MYINLIPFTFITFQSMTLVISNYVLTSSYFINIFADKNDVLFDTECIGTVVTTLTSLIPHKDLLSKLWEILLKAPLDVRNWQKTNLLLMYFKCDITVLRFCLTQMLSACYIIYADAYFFSSFFFF